ncbi:MAG: hypothetical protein ABH891_08405 [Candidatus Omnitrophota bacterium]
MLAQWARSAILFKNKKILIASLVFFFSFLWIVILVQGLPVGCLDEWAMTSIAQQTSWSDFGKHLVLPWSQSAYWFNQVAFYDQVCLKRIVHGILLKFTQSLFGLHSFPYFLITKVFFFCGIVTLVFLFMTYVTGSLGLSLAGAVFFLLIPAHYCHVLWIADPYTIAIFFVTLSMWFFYKFVSALDKGEPLRNLFPWIAGLFVAGWFGIKTKEPALIFPVVAGAYLLIYCRHWKGRGKVVLSVLFLLVLIAFQIVPIEHLNAPVQRLGYHVSSITRFLFRNYQVGADNEPTTAFFSLEALWPVSIARTFGFFSLWGIILFALIHGAGRIFRRSSTPSFFSDPLIRFSAVWVGIEILLVGFFQPEPRFFTSIMIPLSLLSVRLVSCVLNSWQGFVRKILTLAAIFCWVWSAFYLNFQQVITTRIVTGMRNNRLFETARVIYSDIHKDKSPSISDVATFYCPAYALKKIVRPRIDDVVFFADNLYVQCWNKTEDGSLDDFKRFAKTGAVYYVTTDPKKFSGFPDATLVGKVTGINEGSKFEVLRYLKKKKKPAIERVYKYTGTPQ